MSFDLRPRNKEAGGFTWGAFSWSMVLETGIGLPLGYAAGIEPATFIYTPDSKGRCIAYNDGAHVTARQANQMAMIARWIIRVHRTKRKMWDRYTAERREQLEKCEYAKKPYGADFVNRLETFADWLEKSGGFYIH